jgi:hypothetical protein
MTDRGSRRRGLLTVATSALAAFLVVAAALAIQLRMGGDPALGPEPVASAAAPPRKVLIRRVEVRRVIVRIVPRPVAAAGPAPGAPRRGTVVTVPAAPQAAAPTAAPPAVAPPPPPAPAPLVTRSS